MPFVKIDTGILVSTLWSDPEATNIFLTALCMAEPHEVKEAEPQIEVESLAETGWVVPPGWYGLARAAGIGIVQRSHVADQAAGIQALKRLGEPDPGSRSANFDGRRLVRVDGGYLVLNFMRYRDRDYTNAERSRRWRERRAQRRGATAERRCNTQAEAEAEERETPPSPPAGGKARSARPTVQIPDGVTEQTWKDWNTLRRAKRAPVTATGLSRLRSEAQKAGKTLEEVMQFMLQNGYQGYSASWPSGGSGSRRNGEVQHTPNMPLGTSSCNCEACRAAREKERAAREGG